MPISTNKLVKLPLAMVTVAITGFLPGPVSAQFRDLDKPAPTKQVDLAPAPTPAVTEATDDVEAVADSDGLDLIELVPTNQKFTEPLAPIVNAQRDLTQPVTTPKPVALGLAPIPDANALPIAEPEPLPTPDKTTTPQAITLTDQPQSAVAKPMTSALAKPTLAPVLAEPPVGGTPSLAPTKTPQLATTPKLKPTPRVNPLQVFKDGMSPKGPREGIYAAEFNEIQVGETKEDELIEKWGDPVRTLGDEGKKTHIFHVQSFRQVDVTVNEDDEVTGILVHLLEPREASYVAKEIGMDAFDSVLVPDEYGEVLGQAYPERGLLFSYVEDAKPDTLEVAAILIEPISAEMFRLRAQYDFQHNYERCLADLEESIRIDPTDAESYWLRAEYMDACGKTRDALKSAQKAIRLQPANAVYRLTRGRLFAKTNRLKQGIEEVESVIDEIEMRPEIASRAHNLLGDLMAIGPDADHQKALKHHLKAIDFSSNVVDDRRFAVRRLAKHTLVSAHMSIARDIAMGNFQRQGEVVPKWLLRATDLADEFIADDQGDELLQMEIFRDTLASYSELQQGHFEAAIATEEAVTTGRDLISKATDDLYKTQIERLLAETLLHAAKIHRTRGKHVSAMQFATTGLALLDNSQEDWEETSHDNYLKAQLQFVIGSIHAIKDTDHTEAVDWYKKARSLFVGSNFASPLYSDRNHGEMYVSMGLSFWSDGDKNKGIRLTQTGAELMKDAVESGSLQLRAMSVPYGNLATMHNELGNQEKSSQYAKLVAKVEELTTTKKR